MQQALTFEFERLVKEFTEWRAVEEDQRSPAAAWWWGTALAILDDQQVMPREFCAALELPPGSSFAQAGHKLVAAISEQTSLPWPNQFPREVRYRSEEQQETAVSS